MKKQLITASAICALVAGTSMVSAQRGPDSSGGTSAAPTDRAAPSGGMTSPSTQPNSGGPSATEPRGGSQATPERGSSSNRMEMQDRAQSQERMQSQDRVQSQERTQPRDRMQSQDRMQQQDRMQSQDSSPSRNPSQAQSPQQRSPTQAESERNGSQTNVNVNLAPEQRTRIRETVIAQPNAPRISRNEVNFNLRVGTTVPRSVRVAPLPVAVAEIHPAWRGYSYILIGDELVILEPATLRIVAIIPA